MTEQLSLSWGGLRSRESLAASLAQEQRVVFSAMSQGGNVG